MDNILLELAKRFKDEFKENLISVSLHGSVAQEDTHQKSDIDFFLVFSEIDYTLLERLKKLKDNLEKKNNIELSLNIQKVEELPAIRKRAFYHKNRYALFLHEANKIDKTLIGTNPYATKELPSYNEIKLEAIRIINSFAYFLRKFIVNSSIDYSIHEAIRYVIMSTQYANAFFKDYPLSTRESVYQFEKNFNKLNDSSLPIKFLKIKRGEIKIVDKKQLLSDAVIFLEELDEFLFKNFN